MDNDGTIPWPLGYSYNGQIRNHSNIFWDWRGDHYHWAVDMNNGTCGNCDRGAPVYATHDGLVKITFFMQIKILVELGYRLLLQMAK